MSKEATRLEDVIHGLTFRFIQPMTSLPWTLLGRLLSHPHLYALLERPNTVFPSSPVLHVDELLALRGVRRMGTFASGAIINAAVSLMPPGQSYVNVGCWNGFSLFCGMAGNRDKTCIGIDDFSQFGGPRRAFHERFDRLRSPRHLFFDSDYRDYFANHHDRRPIGVYFYDGDHAYDHQLEGLAVAEPFFAPGCIVIIDDTNWPGPRNATEDFLRDRPERYEVLADLRTAENNHPTFWNGLMILRRAA
jgi:hypothetical protein